MKRLLAIALLIVGCGGCGTQSPTPSQAATPTTALTAAATFIATPPPTPAPTPAPTTAPTPIDPAVVFSIFKSGFWTSFEEIYEGQLADALETDYVVVESVDRVTYNEATNVVRIDFTTDYEILYRDDHADWRDDTWELFRDYSREIWGTVMDTIGDELGGQPVNWAKWTPGLVIDAGRLSTSCPGTMIVAIQRRDATQADFAKGCKFTY